MSDAMPRPSGPNDRRDDPSAVDDGSTLHDAPAAGEPGIARREGKPEPGGPYFGRLLIVLFAAVAFCAVITWYLSTSVAP